MPNQLKVFWQYCLPQQGLSRLAGALANSEKIWLKNFLIQKFIARYQVDMQEARETNPEAYISFNAFFTRALRSECRPLAQEKASLISPVDGALSEFGHLKQDSLLQAKNHSYRLTELLAQDAQNCQDFLRGSFATFYLAPRDYHRIHLPVDAILEKITYVPGRLFSVNPLTAATVPQLFARNERAILYFNTAFGKMALVLVGAMIVASIVTRFTGLISRSRSIQTWNYGNFPLKKGEEVGHFQLGSTVILLFEADKLVWKPGLGVGARVQMGQAIAKLGN